MKEEFRQKLGVVLEGISQWSKEFRYSLTEKELTTNFGSAEVTRYAEDDEGYCPVWLEILNRASAKITPSIFDMVQGALAYLWEPFQKYEEQVFRTKYLGEYGYGVCSSSEVADEARKAFLDALLENIVLKKGEYVDFEDRYIITTHPSVFMSEANNIIQILKVQGLLDDEKINKVWKKFQESVSPVFLATAFQEEWLDDERASLAKANSRVIKFREHFKFVERNSEFLALCRRLDS